MSNAEIYMLLTRAAGPPVVGEAWAIPFNGQIELEGWSWDLVNLEENKRAAKEEKERADLDEAMTSKDPNKVKKTSADEIAKDVLDLRAPNKRAAFDSKAPDQQKTEVSKIVAKGLDEVEEALDPEGKKKKDADKDKDPSLQIKFEKSVDLASAQMLNSMKASEIFAAATITVFHRSATTPLLLTVNLTKFRLIEYALSVESGETLTEMKETWTGDFQRFDYVYKNRAPAGMPKSATQAAGVAASQGRIMAFIMRPRGDLL